MTPRQLFALFALALVWGASFLFIRVLLNADMDPVGISGARVGVGALALSPLVWFARAQFPRDRRSWILLAGLGAVNFAIPWTIFPLAQQHIPSGVASIGNSCSPIFASMFAALLLPGEHLTGRRIVGLALGMGGVATLVAGDLNGVDSGSAWGILGVVFATLLYGGSAVFIRRWMSHVGPIALATGQIATAAVILSPIAFVTGGFSGVSMGSKEWSSLLILGAFGSAIGPILYMSLIGSVGPVRASVVTYLIPPIGVFLGWLALDERIGWDLLGAIILIASGVALVQNLPLRRWPAAAYRRLTFSSSPVEP